VTVRGWWWAFVRVGFKALLPTATILGVNAIPAAAQEALLGPLVDAVKALEAGDFDAARAGLEYALREAEAQAHRESAYQAAFYLGLLATRRADREQVEHRDPRPLLLEAVSFYERALKLEPRAGPALNNVAEVYARLKSDAEAERAHAAATEVEGDSRLPFYHRNFGDFLAAHGEWRRAAEQYKLTLQDEPDDQTAHEALAVILRHYQPAALPAHLWFLIEHGRILDAEKMAATALAESTSPCTGRALLAIQGVLTAARFSAPRRSTAYSEAAPEEQTDRRSEIPRATCRNPLRRLGGRTAIRQGGVESEGELRSLFGEYRSDFEEILEQADFAGQYQALASAMAEDGALRSVLVTRDQGFEWMAYRPRDRRPGLLRDACWTGAQGFEAWELSLKINNELRRFIFPKACLNLALQTKNSPPPITIQPLPHSRRLLPETFTPETADCGPGDCIVRVIASGNFGDGRPITAFRLRVDGVELAGAPGSVADGASTWHLPVSPTSPGEILHLEAVPVDVEDDVASSCKVQFGVDPQCLEPSTCCCATIAIAETAPEQRAAIAQQLVVVLAAALAEQSYPPERFAEERPATAKALQEVAARWDVSEGARTLLELHVGEAFSREQYRWWLETEVPPADASGPAAATGQSPRDVFRSLARSLAGRELLAGRLARAEDYFVLAAQFDPRRKDLLAGRGVAETAARTGQPGKLYEVAAWTEERLGDTRSTDVYDYRHDLGLVFTWLWREGGHGRKALDSAVFQLSRAAELADDRVDDHAESGFDARVYSYLTEGYVAVGDAAHANQAWLGLVQAYEARGHRAEAANLRAIFDPRRRRPVPAPTQRDPFDDPPYLPPHPGTEDPKPPTSPF
jgi:tetratricopeptide (TPR) repeat protein